MNELIRIQDMWLVAFTFGLILWHCAKPIDQKGLLLFGFTTLAVWHGYGVYRALLHVVLMYALWRIAMTVMQKRLDKQQLNA